jgi:hypothetical protein
MVRHLHIRRAAMSRSKVVARSEEAMIPQTGEALMPNWLPNK